MKRNTPNIILISALTLFLGACKLPVTEAEKSLMLNPGSIRHTVNWEGTYISTLPGNDGLGTQVVLTLYKNHTFTLDAKSINEASPIDEYWGRFIWEENGNIIVLSYNHKKFNALYFEIGHNHVVMLDSTGIPYQGAESDRYVLRKFNDPMLEKKWRLTELMGTYIPVESRSNIVFKILDQRVKGYDGCSGIRGYYNLDPEEFELSCYISRERSPINFYLDKNQLVEAFEITNIMKLNENHLWLYSDNWIVAKFELADSD